LTSPFQELGQLPLSNRYGAWQVLGTSDHDECGVNWFNRTSGQRHVSLAETDAIHCPLSDNFRFAFYPGVGGLSLSSRVARIDPTKAELDYFRIAGKSHVQVTQIPEIDRANTATL
jgi:hypothetical protein